MTDTPRPEYLTPRIAAKRLGLCRKSVYLWLKRGKFPNKVKLGGSRWRIPASDVEALLKPNRIH